MTKEQIACERLLHTRGNPCLRFSLSVERRKIACERLWSPSWRKPASAAGSLEHRVIACERLLQSRLAPVVVVFGNAEEIEIACERLLQGGDKAEFEKEADELRRPKSRVSVCFALVKDILSDSTCREKIRKG